MCSVLLVDKSYSRAWLFSLTSRSVRLSGGVVSSPSTLLVLGLEPYDITASNQGIQLPSRTELGNVNHTAMTCIQGIANRRQDRHGLLPDRQVHESKFPGTHILGLF